MNTVFLDTGFLIALEMASDQYHQAAVEHWRRITSSLPHLITTSYVFDEVVTFFNNRGHHQKAVEVGSRLLASPSVYFAHVDQELFYAGWEYFQRHTDKEYSLTDCISFLVMERFGIKVVLAFDKHFVQAGFQKQPVQD